MELIVNAWLISCSGIIYNKLFGKRYKISFKVGFARAKELLEAAQITQMQ